MAAKKKKKEVKPKYCTIDLSKIDWKLLREQKLWLSGVAMGKPVHVKKLRSHPQAEGLLGLLDYLMDEAEIHLGTEVVFGKALAKSLGRDSVEV